MTDSEFKPFVGMWLTSPAGLVACAKVINGELLIPYARSGERRLAGHFYECRVEEKTLFGRFKRFASGELGVFTLAVGEIHTLKGGWWTEAKLPVRVRRDVRLADAKLPGMIKDVWVRMPKAKTPAWAAQYFLEWP
ncbi:MAG: hypothetical protein EPO07_17125 [Verrucomicrobia bacterium]|nr:MAG: hypothetical protein EPO07_17125 [Verrucomicrobiota bacterium]